MKRHQDLPEGIVKRTSKRTGKPLYYAVISYKDPETGQYKKRWLSARTKREAEQKRINELHKVSSGDFVKPSKIIFGAWLQTWLAEYAKNRLSPRSLERYREIAEKHIVPAIGGIRLQQLTLGHLESYYNMKSSHGSSSATVELHHTVIHGCLKDAVKRQLILRNPADNAGLKRREHKEIQIWNETEIKRFLEAARDSEYYMLFAAALFTGMRRSELLGLQWRDIDLIGSTISICRGLHYIKGGKYIVTEPKTKSSRRLIDMPPSLYVLLKKAYDVEKLECLAQSKNIESFSWVFHNRDGEPLKPNNITITWKKIAKRIGLNVIRFHDARHSHASLMLKKGVHPKTVQERLGHSSIEITLDIYSHVMPGIGKEAARKFDEAIGINLVDGC
jgi:integrase